MQCFHLGIQDGSLRKDMTEDLFVATFFNFISGMISRLGEMGDKVQIEFGVSTQGVFTQIFRVFLDGLKFNK